MKKRFERLRLFAAHVLNPSVLKFAGSRYSPFAALHHIGRKSGKPYKTPLVIRPTKGGFVLTLTYGPEVDWYRNITAAERATLLWHGREYSIARPVSLDTNAALTAFSPLVRFVLSKLKVQDFALAPVEAVRGNRYAAVTR